MTLRILFVYEELHHIMTPRLHLIKQRLNGELHSWTRQGPLTNIIP